mgnify:CR=1 FL=1
MSKIQSESNSQRVGVRGGMLPGCDQYVKDTIWKQFTTIEGLASFYLMLWPICQRYNLKAIHNSMLSTSHDSLVVTNMSKIQSESNSQHMICVIILQPVVTNMSKIQSESNSQHKFLCRSHRNCCDQYVKDTIWKQFTTSKLVTRWRN